MGGYENRQEGLFIYVAVEAEVPAGHSLRPMRLYADCALQRARRVFDAMRADGIRRPLPLQTMLKGTLRMALEPLRSEGLFCEGSIQPAVSLVSGDGRR